MTRFENVLGCSLAPKPIDSVFQLDNCKVSDLNRNGVVDKDVLYFRKG